MIPSRGGRSIVRTRAGKVELSPPRTPAALHEWLRQAMKIELPTSGLIDGNTAPFDYVCHTFFEGRRFDASGKAVGTFAPADAAVWASRGGGKTFLGAVATMLDLVFKKGIEVRILGGSLEQSQRMHEHLRRLFESPLISSLLDGPITQRSVLLRSGSRAQVLAQSHTSVRGTRVQKVRCDEVELFDREVWEAAQLATRSLRVVGPWGSLIRGSIEALSTMHKPYGLMWNIVGESAIGTAPDDAAKRRLFRWGIVDVLSECGDEHQCASCTLHPECGGRAKTSVPNPDQFASMTHDLSRVRVPGHVGVDDAVRMKARVSEDVWRAEMLSQRPRRSDSVYPEFDPCVHVGDWDSFACAAQDGPNLEAGRVMWVAGMDFGFRSPTVVLLARHDEATKTLYIDAEHIKSEWTLAPHIAHVRSGMANGFPMPAWFGVDPAGHQRSEQTGISCVAGLRKAGLVVRARRMELHEGVSLVRARLRPAGGEGGATPTLYIHRRCERLIEAMQRYHYPEDRLESLQPVKDGFDHAADALRYLIVNLDRPHRTTCGSYL